MNLNRPSPPPDAIPKAVLKAYAMNTLRVVAALVAVGLLVWQQGGLPDFASWVSVNNEIDMVAVVYESDPDAPDYGGLPPDYTAGLTSDKVGHEYRYIDDDQENGLGDLPAQYALVVPAAREHGLPVLVIQRGDKVEVMPVPETLEAFEEVVE